MNHTSNMLRATLVAGFSLLALTGAAMAQMMDHAHHGHNDGKSAGQPGNVAAATRTIQVDMADISFNLDRLDVKQGETVRFVVANKGELLHEFNIGTAASNVEHRKMMAMMVDHGMITATGINKDMAHMDHSAMGMGPMNHHDANSVLVEPGKKAELVWTFGTDASLEFACNIPGHYEAGMAGPIAVAK